MFDDQLLEAYINGFYGYGNYQAPYWFVGMEEGGGNSHEEIVGRLEVWSKRGHEELEDLAQYHRELGMSRFFDAQAKLQSTWKQLIRVVLTANGQTYDVETIREYQRSRLGTKDGETCLLELLPLPSPNIASWLYGEHSDLPYLLNRETYGKHVTDSRIAHFQGRIIQHQPKAVVFYGIKYRVYWEKIAGIESWEKSSEGVDFASNGNTLLVVAKHPVAMGSTNEYFRGIGKLAVS